MKVHHKYEIVIKLEGQGVNPIEEICHAAETEVSLDINETKKFQPHHFEILIPKFWIGNDNSTIRGLLNPVDGKVCLYEDSNQLDAVVDIVAENGAKALIVYEQPRIAPSLPVFCIPRINLGARKLVGVVLTLDESTSASNTERIAQGEVCEIHASGHHEPSNQISIDTATLDPKDSVAVQCCPRNSLESINCKDYPETGIHGYDRVESLPNEIEQNSQRLGDQSVASAYNLLGSDIGKYCQRSVYDVNFPNTRLENNNSVVYETTVSGQEIDQNNQLLHDIPTQGLKGFAAVDYRRLGNNSGKYYQESFNNDVSFQQARLQENKNEICETRGPGHEGTSFPQKTDQNNHTPLKMAAQGPENSVVVVSCPKNRFESVNFKNYPESSIDNWGLEESPRKVEQDTNSFRDAPTQGVLDFSSADDHPLENNWGKYIDESVNDVSLAQTGFQQNKTFSDVVKQGIADSCTVQEFPGLTKNSDIEMGNHGGNYNQQAVYDVDFPVTGFEQKQGIDYSSTAQTFYGSQEKSEIAQSGGMMNAIVSNVTGVFKDVANQITGRTTFENKLIELWNSSGWESNANFFAYRKSLDILRGLRDKDKSRKEIVKEITSSLRQDEFSNIERLVFAGHLWMWTDCCGKTELLQSIVECISMMNLGDKTKYPPLQHYQNVFKQDEKPQILLKDFFQEMFKEQLCLNEPKSSFWVNTLFLWDRCGLLRPIHWPSWKIFRLTVGTDFCQTHSAALCSLMGKKRVQTYSLFFQTTALAFNQSIKDMVSQQSLTKLETCVADAIQQLMEELILEASNKENAHGFLASEFKLIFDAIRIVNFRPRDEFKAWVVLISFQSQGTFDFYEPFADAVTSHSCYWYKIREQFHINLCQDLCSPSDGPKWNDLLLLLQSNVWKFCPIDDKMAKAILKCSENVISNEANLFGEALEILGHVNLYTIRSKKRLGRNSFNSKDFENGVFTILEGAIKNHAGGEVLRQVFGVAQDNHSIFCSSEQEKLVERVANHVVAVTIWNKNNLGLLNDVVPDPGVHMLKFQQTLLKSIQIALVKKCKSMKEASEVFLSLCSGKTSLPSSMLAAKIFQESFDKWKPDSLAALLSQDESVIHLFFSCFQEFPYDESTTDHFSDMVRCKDYIVKLVSDWLSSFRSEQISYAGLETGLELSENCFCSWSKLEKHTSLKIPSKASIKEKIDEFQQNWQTIDDSLSAPSNWKFSMLQVLEAYRCNKISTEYGKLFSTYAASMETLPRTARSQRLKQRRIEAITLLHVREHKSVAVEFCHSYSETLSLCHYFLSNPSLIFSTKVLLRDIFDLEDLKLSVDLAIESIVQLFEPSSSVGNASNVVGMFSADDATFEDECNVLLNCKTLKLKEHDTNRLLVVEFFFRQIEEIRSFVNCCEQFKFEFALSDNTFLTLKSVLERTFPSNLNDITLESCEEGCHNIYSLLCEKSAIELVRYDEMKKDLEKLLPMLKLLGRLSRHGEVWNLAREMQWFGEEGRQRFNTLYANVTNVLLGETTESYYMSVLNSLEPTVRLISAFAEQQDRKSFVGLIRHFEKDSNIQDWLKNASYGDFEQTQNNLSLIRGWFCDGVDEIAHVFRVYRAVRCTGRYAIISDDDTNGKFLALTYKSDGEKAMSGNELDSFIEQIGMVQREEESEAEAVEMFVELHHCISDASRNIIEMHSIGFEDIDPDSFSCMADERHLVEARLLMKQSVELKKKCHSWLTSVRSRYTMSLLFWTEELKEMHKLLAEDDSQQLAQKVSRLLPASSSERKYKTLLNETVSVAGEMQFGADDDSNSWLIRISEVLENIHNKIGAPRQIRGQNSFGKMVLHTLSCDDKCKSEAMIRVIQSIYKNRLPEEFEVLDGLSRPSSERLSLFLHRAVVFSSGVFVLINIEELGGEQLETVLSFLSNRDNASTGAHFHCVQREQTIQHTAPWVEGKSWDTKAFTAVSTRNPSWMDMVLDDINFGSVTLVTSSTCGSGKTSYIRRELRNIQKKEKSCEIGTIIVHEKSTAQSLARQLASTFSLIQANRALHISFTYIPWLQSEGSSDWLKSMNHFFFSLLVLHVVHDPNSLMSFQIARGRWRVFVEMPANETKQEGCLQLHGRDWLLRNIPILGVCCTSCTPPNFFHVDEETRRVCTYLRAFEDGTIDRKFQPGGRRRIVFVLDKSESMEIEVSSRQSALRVATRCAIRIFDSHVECDDTVGVVMFNHNTSYAVPIQKVDSEIKKKEIRARFQKVGESPNGSTNMYSAIDSIIRQVNKDHQNMETWIVCLTDGETWDSDKSLRRSLARSSQNLHIILIGVNLPAIYEEKMKLLCRKYQPQNETKTKGFFIRASATLESLNQSFGVVSRSIPVSRTFEFDGKVTDDECRRLIRKYAPTQIKTDNMQLLSFWVRFLYRRVKVFDANESFNYNETHENLGSSLMETMLSEVKRLLDNDRDQGFTGKSHAQLIYDFTNPDAPEFRLLCTSPKQLEASLRSKYESLQLPGFFLPTESELQNRDTLDRYLSQSMNIPLEKSNCGMYRLECIDNHGFILTLDFTIKLLNIHERVACKLPCILEGETGVSKTALTKMYSILRNSSLSSKAAKSTLDDLTAIEVEIQAKGYATGSGSSPYLRLQSALGRELASNQSEFPQVLQSLIEGKCQKRSDLYEKIPEKNDDPQANISHFLDWFSSSKLLPTFFEVNVDASLSELDIVECFRPIREVAQRLADLEALVVVFLDEINTSSVMGLFKEIVVDRSLQGEALEDNIVIITACNPFRSNASCSMSTSREKDLGRDWASGHYQVMAIPPSMAQLKWSFGSLNRIQEKDFIFRRLENLVVKKIPASLRMALTELIAESQEAMREFASRNIQESLRRREPTPGIDIEKEAMLRARSVVSLRDIQRVFSLFDFFLYKFEAITRLASSAASQKRYAMLLAIAVVYYLRLDTKSRSDFLQILRKLKGEQRQKEQLQEVLNSAMDIVTKESLLPEGIASTRGLKENIFMTLVCTLSRTPLMIVGPPGTSKTLSVNVVGDNANGDDSSSPFYRQFARLSIFHYQCSKESTSKEIASVFKKASERQAKVDLEKHRCAVVMDEAGLPEEERESLKVLHYLLEGHMSMKAKVGFVAITNHVLDAAKVNRCVMLLRQEPDLDEMLTIIKGILFRHPEQGSILACLVDIEGELFTVDSFSRKLSTFYAALLQIRVDGDGECFDTFFGLRDFIYFLKAVRSMSTLEMSRLTLPVAALLRAIERNFNGVSGRDLRRIIKCFFDTMSLNGDIISSTRHPISVLREALTSKRDSTDLSVRARFKLIIDCSEDDSIMRLLNSAGLVNISKKSLFKLSSMPEEVLFEKLRLIAGVKFAASQGHVALLSQTESVNESFYDLFNQNFRAVTGRNGKVSFYANIAVGGISRRSLVCPQFECIVHIRKSQLNEIPAPFLNRFEKFRLDIKDVLTFGWSAMGGLASVMKKARERTAQLIAILGKGGLFGSVDDEERTLDSVFVNLLPNWALEASQVTQVPIALQTFENFPTGLAKFLDMITSSNLPYNASIEAIEHSIDCLPNDDCQVLKQMTNDGTVDVNARVSSVLSSLLCTNNTEALSMICEKLLQMAITRHTTSCLLQIATPEAVFANRNLLPTGLLDQYFQREHFSLKNCLAQMLGENDNSSSNSSLIAVYTRTDALIHGIPTITAKQDTIAEESKQRIKDLVSDRPDELIVEHLELLRSEAALRNAVSSWIQHQYKRVFLLIVDMGSSHATDRVNYVRMCVEQVAAGATGKTFLLLLHYSPSCALRGSCYPALFLGGWHHIFLDGVGQQGPALGISQWIEIVCKKQKKLHKNNSEMTGQFKRLLLHLLPRVLSHSVSQRVLYPRQLEGGQSDRSKRNEWSFSLRQRFLNVITETYVGSNTVGEILCSKFAHLWLNHALEETVNKAAHGLRSGTTQMSVTSSLHSNLVETFDTYIALSLAEMNQWRNLDILAPAHRNGEVEAIFGEILQQLPVPPLEELALRRERSIAVRSIPPEVFKANGRQSVKFPFFFLVSSVLDEIVEKAETRHLEKKPVCTDSEMHSAPMTPAELFRCAMTLILDGKQQSDGLDGLSDLPERECLVQDVVKLVQSSRNNGEGSLFKRYLHQFVEWKVGCDANPFVVHWMENAAGELDKGSNLCTIHCIARCRRRELLTIASWSLIEKQQLPPILVKPFVSRAKTENRDFVCNEKGTDDAVTRFFLGVLKRFEEAATDNNIRSVDWSHYFSIFLQSIGAIESSSLLENIDAMHRLQVLCLIHFLIDASAAQSVQQATLDYWYDKDCCKIRDNEHTSSLRELFCTVVGNNALQEILFRRFFSKSLVLVTKRFRYENFEFLTEMIESGSLCGNFAVSLLFRACLHFEPSGRPKETSTMLGLPITSLSHISKRLCCEGLLQFSGDGMRKDVPHFIPAWLRANGQDESTESDGNAQIYEQRIFFSGYRHRFSGLFSDVVFHMVLGILLREAEKLSSTDLLWLLLQDIEAEEDIERNMQEELLPQRDFVSQCDSFRGSPIGILVADARVICFVAKVAYEFAVQGAAEALSGTYAQDAHSIMAQVMMLQGVRFQNFFFSQILRLRGEGTLACLLNRSGPLHSTFWCHSISRGMASVCEDQAKSLKTAEEKLEEAIRDEESKSREFRLCPNCGTEFGVDRENCGQFTCGRDAHLLNSKPAVGGKPVKAVYGCGHSFSIDTAAAYVANEKILLPLRKAVADIRVKVRESNLGALQLKHAKEMVVPRMFFSMIDSQSDNKIVPTVILPMTDTNNLRTSLFKILMDGVSFINYLSLIPDLIEFYDWVYSTFRCLVSKECALNIMISQVMKKECLRRRFDSNHTSHMLRLWERLVMGVNSYLRNYKVMWGCQEIKIPFNRIEQAPLVAFLSEGCDPSDGSDFFFLIINDIINRYNSFVRRFSVVPYPKPQCRDTQPELSSMHPRFIMSGTGGAVAIASLPLLSQSDFETLVYGCWDSEKDEFRSSDLDRALQEAVSLHRLPPGILNPVECLREQFPFRDDKTSTQTPAKKNDVIIYRSPHSCYYYARIQDFNLVNDVRRLLQDFALSDGDPLVRGPLEVKFHTLESYSHVVKILEGLRNLFELLKTEGEMVFGAMEACISRAIKNSEESVQDDLQRILHDLGFPDLSSSQTKLLLSLDSTQVVEMVSYLDYQLASEGYMYAGLPLCMADPLGCNDRSVVETAMANLCSRKGAQQSLNLLDDFVRDILLFYEKLIRDEAVSRRCSLRAFLFENNFCDDTDPVCAILPDGITVNNYISLRQLLYQERLCLLYKLLRNNQDKTVNTEQNEITAMRQNSCWLWEPNVIDVENGFTDNHSVSADDGVSWWLEPNAETNIEAKNNQLAKMIDNSVIDNSAEFVQDKEQSMQVTNDNDSASMIQRWWRNSLHDRVAMEV